MLINATCYARLLCHQYWQDLQSEGFYNQSGRVYLTSGGICWLISADDVKVRTAIVADLATIAEKIAVAEMISEDRCRAFVVPTGTAARRTCRAVVARDSAESDRHSRLQPEITEHNLYEEEFGAAATACCSHDAECNQQRGDNEHAALQEQQNKMQVFARLLEMMVAVLRA